MSTIQDIESSIFGVTILNQDVFLSSAGSNNDGVYYTKVFQKPDAHSWYQVLWLSNEDKYTIDINRNTLNKFFIEVRARVGNNLPWDYVNNQRYSLADVNSLIVNDSQENMDALLYRMTIGRSITSSVDTAIISPPNITVFNMGSAQGYTRLAGENDGTWSYWSLPIVNSPSYIPYNEDFNFLQLRITLKNLSPLIDPTTQAQYFSEVYRTTVSSILKKT
jgi:hypothetical protein